MSQRPLWVATIAASSALLALAAQQCLLEGKKMKGICANLTTLFLSAAALAAALVSLNVAAGLVTVSLPVVVNALALGALISVGACVLTTLFGRSHRHVFCYAFSMAFATIAFLFTVAHFNISHEMLIAYGSAGALGFGAGIVGSGLSRLIHGQP